MERGNETAKVLPWLALSAVAVSLLAAFSPLEMVDSDPAMALVAAQAILDHGTLALDVYRGHPGFAYKFDIYNHRVKELGEHHYYYNLGVPILSLPVVWLANRLGYDMLDQGDEAAVQNLVSAVLTALFLVLLYRLGRFFLAPGPSLVVAVVSTLGSSLASTLATALWSTDYQVVLISLVLILLLGRGRRELTLKYLAALAILLTAAFLCRPTAAFLGVAVLVHLLGESDRRVVLGARLLLGAAAAVVVLAALDLVPWLPQYYSPRKILPATSPLAGLYGALLSPSRGLFVYSPFLLLVTAAAVKLRAWRGDRLLRLVALWIALHVAGVALKEVWWGGHCFGPRLLAEVMPGFVVLTCWAWRGLASSPPRRRAALAAAYLVLGSAGVFIHSYQGLFKPATQRWNRYPNVDNPAFHELLFDWRYPQFLATDAALEERFLDLQRRTAGIYRSGEELAYDSPDLLFTGWHEPEDGWRWSRGKTSALIVQLDSVDPERAWVLELHASALGHQEVSFAVNGVALGDLRFDGYAPRRQALVVRGGVLRSGENTIRLEVPGATRTPRDRRVMGLALRSLRLYPLADDFAVTYRDDAYFVAGFSVAEGGWRWTDGPEARLLYPVAEVVPAAPYALELEAGAYGEQRVEVLVNGTPLGAVELAGHEPRRARLDLPGKTLGPYRTNLIELRIPGAVSPEGDARRLGLMFRSLRISPRPP